MSGFTLTHVGMQLHPFYGYARLRNLLALSALTMVIMAENPPSPEASSHYMNSFTMFNRRNRLKPDYPMYPGYAVSFSAIRMPISAHLSADGSFLPLDKDMLLKGAEIVKGQYRTQMEIPSGLSYSAQLGEILTSRIVQAVNANAYVREIQALYVCSHHNREPATNLSIGFVSDGKGESFLNPTFTTDTGKAVLSISKPCLTVNRLGSIP